MNQTKFFKDLIPEFADEFVFSLEYKRALSNTISSITSNSRRSNESVQKKLVGKLKQEEILPPKEIKRRLKRISESIEALLHHGAELIEAMPFPSFFMALFTKCPSIVESFLKRNADPNYLYQGMTPLQIVCCMEPSDELCDIVNMLIQYEADVNILSDPSVWRECDHDLIRNNVTRYDVKPQGKNALHFICLREDVTEFGNTFLCRITEILFQAGIRTGLLYQGHSYLSIAVLKGNTDLIRCLSKFIDIRRTLGSDLGNALTVLALKRYPYIIPFHTCKQVIDCLFDLGISPFETLYDYYNIFEFFDDEWPPSIGEEVKSWNAYATHIKRYQSLIKQASFTHIHTNCNTISKIYIREKSRSILDVINRYKAVMYLYNFFKEIFVNKHTVYLAKMIGSSNEAAINLEVIFLCEKLPQSWFSNDTVTRLFEYVDEVNKNPKNEEIKHNIRFENRKRISKYICDNLELYSIAQWVSDKNIYQCEVCYFCMHKKYKVLLKCPLCGIVKFCSKRCNYLSNKFKTIHACSTIFYQDVFKENQLFIDKNEPIPLYGIDLDLENARKR
ncbi:hypothetical protein WA026_011024 [Henosepilachna vigintioctopunctata]|uniref:Uncharacterized protein n=1 Tax=Henosepilachna vigintioctopunctata TaxID=420089 RepID=A0AAW1UXG2_9CUCU